MHCLISVVMRDWTAVFDEMQALKRQLLAPAADLGIARPPALARTRGFVVVVDWDGERALAGIELDKPLGFLHEPGRLHVALWGDDAVSTLVGREIVARRGHRHFNHVHTLDRTARGLLVSSSGTDLLAEIDEHGEVLWECFMFAHERGGRRFRLGQRFDRGLDYNGRYIPAALSTHPNSALLTDDDVVLATLFSTGELVRIDRRTGQVDAVLAGLKRPHAIRRRPGGGYMLCDTEGGRVVLLAPDLRVAGEIAVPAPWIQDAVLAGERLLAVGNRRIVMGPLRVAAPDADGDNAVLELRGGAPVRRLSFGADNRVYMVEPIAAQDAEELAHAWHEPALDLSFLRWERG